MSRSALGELLVYPAGAVVTPNDAADLPGGVARGGLWIGGAGAVALVDSCGNDVVIAAAPAGGRIPLQVARVLDTGTDATDIVALYVEPQVFA